MLSTNPFKTYNAKKKVETKIPFPAFFGKGGQVKDFFKRNNFKTINLKRKSADLIKMDTGQLLTPLFVPQCINRIEFSCLKCRVKASQ